MNSYERVDINIMEDGVMRLGYSNCTDEQNTAGAAVIFVKWTNYNSNRESNRFGLLL